MILSSLNIKHGFVTADPFERGVRKALNFGHTVGHAIESVSLETDAPLLHGEAVAIGMICEAYLSHKLVRLSENALADIVLSIIRRYGKHNLQPENWDKYITLMQQDKKNSHGQILCTLLPTIGEVVVNQPVSVNNMKECLAFYTEI